MATDHDHDHSDKWDWQFVPSQCDLCARLSDVPGPTPVCQAFPSAIPFEVLANEIDHRRPVEGDEGMGEPGEHVLFEPRPDVEPGVLERLYQALDQTHAE